jgi:hypothetical protein
MVWDSFATECLTRAAVGGFVILAAAAGAVRLCRQPVDRVRVIGLALVAAVVVPWSLRLRLLCPRSCKPRSHGRRRPWPEWS